jgi:hypothetical protein
LDLAKNQIDQLQIGNESGGGKQKRNVKKAFLGFLKYFICRPLIQCVGERWDLKLNPGLLRLGHWQSDALTTWLDVIHKK